MAGGNARHNAIVRDMRSNFITRMAAAVMAVSITTALAACASTPATPTPTTPVGADLPTATPVTPVPTPTATVKGTVPTATPDEPDGGVDLLAMGQDLFDKTAGGLGCAYCHGADALGDPVLGSPDIRGVTEDQIWDALETRAQMTFITMSAEEVKAVSAYLGTISNE